MYRIAAVALVSILSATAPFAARSAGAAPAPGSVLDTTTWQQAEGLLPPEILSHYRAGEYVSKVDEWKDGAVRWGEEFTQATAENRERLDVTPQGTIVDRRTGQRPEHVYGFPFPAIDPADPNAAVKILWNYFYGYWSNGSRRNISVLEWLGPGSRDRAAVQDVYYLQYDGIPADARPKSNPTDLLQQFLSTALEPADLQGTTALAWRYRAPDRRDSNWAYVPVLRRVRAVTPANRSDGFLGSDMSQDDGPFFDGKPEDFAWKLVGETQALRLADPYSLSGDYEYLARKDGGWRVPFKPVPMAGFQDPEWKGLPWAPRHFVLVERPFWIIEGVPRDSYYKAGKIQLYIDKENFRGAWSRKFDWAGELISTYQIGGYVNGTPDGKHFFWGHGLYYQVAEDFKRRRATFAGVPPPGMEQVNDFFVPLEPTFFDNERLIRFSK